MKKLFALLIAVAMLAALVSCGGGQGGTTTQTGGESEPLKLGLGIISKAADSKLEIGVAYAAVLLDKDGKIVDCQIDELVASSTEAKAEVKTKGELGADYGMKDYSGIGKEWNEQVDALEEYCKGKTKAEIMGISIDENGKAADTDLKGSATIAISGLIDVVVKACTNARELGSKTGDTLKVASVNASKYENSKLTLTSDICALTVDKDGKVTASVIDSVEPSLEKLESGMFVSSNEITKGDQKESYGMKEYSGIGKEWYEQVEGFCSYLKGKTASEISGIAISESGKAEDEDLLASATIAIAQFKAVAEKALK